MSIYHSKKCTWEEAQAFKQEVRKWLDDNALPYKKLVALPAYEGEVRIHTGITNERLSKRKVMQKDEVGYFRSKKMITEKQHFSVYREDWRKNKELEQTMIKQWLQKSVEKFATNAF